MKCPFCEIVQNQQSAKVVREDERHLAFLDNKPQMPGHVLVIPKVHVETWLDMSGEDFASLMVFCHKLGLTMEQKLQPALVFEKLIGTEIPHVHVHLLPWRSPNVKGLTLWEIQQKMLE